MHVAVIDIGKPGKNLGWAIAGPSPSSGTDLDEAVKEVASCMQVGAVALGFEAPMYVPMRDVPADLTKARDGECGGGVNRPYSAGAGSAVLVTACVVVPYVLKTLRLIAPTGVATMSFDEFSQSPSQLLLFEAFVTHQENSHANRHVEDAELAANHLLRAWESGTPPTSAVSEPSCLNLLGAMMLRTGWTRDLGVLETECLVVRP